MQYTLELNAVGQLNGWQDVKYELNGQTVVEHQLFKDGKFAFGNIVVLGVGTTRYIFNTEAWGSFEIMRDMAEGFVMDYEFNFILKGGDVRDPKRFDVLPSNEGAFINAV